MEYVKIAENRIGSIIGKEGEVKSLIEDEMGVHLQVNSSEGLVTIENRGSDPLAEWKTRDVVRSLNYGIDLKNALKLKDDDYSLIILDLCDIVGRSKKAILRQKARIIGRGGKAKAHISELTGASVAVKGRHVVILGRSEEAEVAREAVEAIAEGLPHGVVYKVLEKKCSAMKMERNIDLWRHR